MDKQAWQGRGNPPTSSRNDCGDSLRNCGKEGGHLGVATPPDNNLSEVVTDKVT